MSTCSQKVEVYSKTTDKLISSGSMTCENIDTLRRLGYKIIEISKRPVEQVLEQPEVIEEVIEEPVKVEEPVEVIEEEQVLINNIPVDQIQQVNVIKPTLQIQASNLINVTLNLIEQNKTLNTQITELKLTNQGLKNENEDLVSKYSDSATKQELEDMTKLFETTFTKAENYKIQAITASEARVGVHPRVEGRAIQGQKHEAFRNDINEDWEKFKESVNR